MIRHFCGIDVMLLSRDFINGPSNAMLLECDLHVGFCKFQLYFEPTVSPRADPWDILLIIHLGDT